MAVVLFCQAMVKRTSQSGLDSSNIQQQAPSPFSMETMLHSSLRRRLSSPSPGDRHLDSKLTEKVSKAREALSKQIEVGTLFLQLVSTDTSDTNICFNWVLTNTLLLEVWSKGCSWNSKHCLDYTSYIHCDEIVLWSRDWCLGLPTCLMGHVHLFSISMQ